MCVPTLFILKIQKHHIVVRHVARCNEGVLNRPASQVVSQKEPLEDSKHIQDVHSDKIADTCIATSCLQVKRTTDHDTADTADTAVPVCFLPRTDH